MRIPSLCLVVAIAVAIPSVASAQPDRNPAPVPDSSPAIAIASPQEILPSTSIIRGDRIERLATVGPRFALQGRHDPRRKPFIVTGAILGAAAGAAYGIHDAREGYEIFGAILLVPVGIISGGALGAGGGYLISLAVLPPR